MGWKAAAVALGIRWGILGLQDVGYWSLSGLGSEIFCIAALSLYRF